MDSSPQPSRSLIRDLAPSFVHLAPSTTGKIPLVGILSAKPSGAPLLIQVARVQASGSSVASPHAQRISGVIGESAFVVLAGSLSDLNPRMASTSLFCTP